MNSSFLPVAVLIGGVLGILIGSISPLLAATISPIGTIYVRLMEVVVLPYLVSSLILGLGKVTPQIAIKLFRKSWRIYILLWVTVFTVLMIAASTVPLVKHSTTISFAQTISTAGDDDSLIDLLVPNNLFEALSQNYIPSIVLMGVLFGIAVQRIENREGLLDVLAVVQSACVRIWQWVVLIAPIGVCALLAQTINSMSPGGFAAMSIYISVVILSALFLALWILPMLMTAFVPLRYWEIVSALRRAYLIGVVTSLSVAALPTIQSAAQTFARKLETSADESEQTEIIQTSLSISYPLAQIGNFFILVFALYAAYYFSIALDLRQIVELPFVTLMSGIGSPTSSIGAVSFMADWLNMPKAATELYVETAAVTRYAQVIASISGFAFITVLVTFAFYGRLRFNARALAVTICVAAAVLAAIWSLGRWGGAHIQFQSEDSYRGMGLPADIQALSDANLASRLGQAQLDEQLEKSGGADAAASGHVDADSTLGRIQSEGVLRVGINPSVMPFAYTNDAGRMVGYDVELIYRFAQDMNVELVFVPYQWQSLTQDLVDRRFDIAISGIYITNRRQQTLTVSDPYYENPMALMVRSERVGEFSSREMIGQLDNLTIAVFDDPVLIPLAKRSFPSAKFKIVPSYDDLVLGDDIHAAIWTREQARAWAISRKGYSAVVPENMAYRFLFGYLMPPNSTGLADYLNYWISLETANGLMADMAERWIDPAFDDKH